MQTEGLWGIPIAHLFMAIDEVDLFRAFIGIPTDQRGAFLALHASHWRTFARMTTRLPRLATLDDFIVVNRANPIVDFLLGAAQADLQRHWCAVAYVTRFLYGRRARMLLPSKLLPMSGNDGRESAATWTAQTFLPALESAFVREEMVIRAVDLVSQTAHTEQKWVSDDAWLAAAAQVPYEAVKRALRVHLADPCEPTYHHIQKHVNGLFENRVWSACYGTRPLAKEGEVLMRATKLPQLAGTKKRSFYWYLTIALILMRIHGPGGQRAQWYLHSPIPIEPPVKRICFE